MNSEPMKVMSIAPSGEHSCAQVYGTDVSYNKKACSLAIVQTAVGHSNAFAIGRGPQFATGHCLPSPQGTAHLSPRGPVLAQYPLSRQHQTYQNRRCQDLVLLGHGVAWTKGQPGRGGAGRDEEPQTSVLTFGGVRLPF